MPSPFDGPYLLDFEYRSDYPDGLPGHHKGGPATELSAALDALKRAGKNMKKVYVYIHASGDRGVTDWEGRADLMYSFPQRRCDLLKRGLIEDSGKTRKTPRGSEATVWVVK